MPPQELVEGRLNYEVVFQEEEVKTSIENFFFFFFFWCVPSILMSLSLLLFYYDEVGLTVHNCNSLDLQTIYVY